MIRRLSLLILALTAWPVHAQMTYMGGRPRAAAVCSHDCDILIFNTYENGCPDTVSPYTFGSGEYSNGTQLPTYIVDAGSGDPGVATAAAAAQVGSCGLAIQGDPSNVEALDFPISSSDIFSTAEGSIGFWFQPRLTYGGIALPFRVNGGGAGSEFDMYYYGDTTGSPNKLEFDISDGTNPQVSCPVSGASSGLVVGSFFFIELKWQASSNNMIIKVTTTGGSTVTTTCCLSGGGCTSNIGTFVAPPAQTDLRLGTATNKDTNFYFDNFMISNSYTRNLTTIRSSTSSPR